MEVQVLSPAPVRKLQARGSHLRWRGTPREFGAASPRDSKTPKEPGKTIGSNHVLGERRKEKFLITNSIQSMNLTPLEYILIISTLLEFNPLFQAIKSVRKKSVKDVSLYTFLSIVIIGTLWLIYGISIHNWPLIIGNAIKLFTALSMVIIYFKYQNKDDR